MPQGGFSRDFQTATNLRHRAEQELKNSYQRSEKLYKDARKHLKTQGVDLPKSGDDKGFEEFFDKMIKRAKGRV